MASFSCHVFAGTKRFRLERIVSLLLLFLSQSILLKIKVLEEDWDVE